jgi:hypothetical protein
MTSRESLARWYRNRFVWVAVILLATAAGATALLRSNESDDLQTQIMTRMRTTLEQSSPGQHNHAGQAAEQGPKAAVTCGVRVYGYEPTEVTALAEVRKVYGFHLCGVAEQKSPWDFAVKLAVDRLRELFPAKYAEMAQKEALAESEMADLRRRYEAAAGL